ncbi:hypothetical protein H2203_008384 [Taxawa tesnikishii (nom. ined.)]|nr:hypothetical protein H2203_008384 [Dothideales sp. JES 119]
MLFRSLWLGCLLAAGSNAQSSGSPSTDTATSTLTDTSTSIAPDTRSILTLSGTNANAASSFTGTYAAVTGQSTVPSSLLSKASTASGSSSRSGSASSAAPGTTSTITLLAGGGAGIVTQLVINGTTTSTLSSNSTASSMSSGSSTSTAAQPTNTQPCNGYPEFCSRKYSNITEVCAHNAAFSISGNSFSNQALSITQQLNDGIRMIQGQVHYENNTIWNCHTSCSILNAGTWQAELEEIATWVRSHPYDVVTLLVGNYDYVDVGNFTAPLEASGLMPYIYTPPKVPMRLNDWPTLSEMILNQDRVVVFMDYQANQTAVPYILDEFTHMFETPFSPTNVSFPCTIQRPPTLTNQTTAREEWMYLANHNLNVEVSFLGNSILIPNTADLNVTNAAGQQLGMLGAMDSDCTERWDRPPNFLLVDYYNVGSGSVFEVAARANGVTYTGQCCGTAASSPAGRLRMSGLLLGLAAGSTLLLLFWQG